MNRTLVAYSGGFSSSVLIPWLAKHSAGEVVTVTLDVGAERELAAVRERALSLGAVRAHVIDAREEFVRDYVLPALRAGVFPSADAPLVHGLVRPLIAARLVELARMESATAVAHAGGAGLTACIRALNPVIEIVDPCSSGALSDGLARETAQRHGIQPPAAAPWRASVTVWSRVVEASSSVLPPAAFTLTRDAADAPGSSARLEIEFAAGTPVRTNGLEMPLVEMIESLETIAGAHGVGRIVGADRAWAIESPAAAVLNVALAALERRALGADLVALRAQMGGTQARLIVEGRLASDAGEAIGAFIRILSARLTGTVRMLLTKGDCVIEHVDVPARQAVA